MTDGRISSFISRWSILDARRQAREYERMVLGPVSKLHHLMLGRLTYLRDVLSWEKSGTEQLDQISVENILTATMHNNFKRRFKIF